MSIAFNHLGWTLLFTAASAIVLLVWMGVLDQGWPISVSICHMYTASFAFKNNAPNSASAIDGMTALIIVATVNFAPLLGGEELLFARKECPHTQLCAFFSFAYPA
jgi:hypothetical protein